MITDSSNKFQHSISTCQCSILIKNINSYMHRLLFVCFFSHSPNFFSAEALGYHLSPSGAV